MTFSLTKYRDACRAYDDLWLVGDKVLYDLCKRYPGHRDRAGVNAKLWLIARAYTTGIERAIPSNGAQSNSIEQLDGFIWKMRGRVDAVIDALRAVAEPLTPDKLTRILKAHGEFVRLLRGVVGENRTPRSFASKDLHFHNPVVPIYDSIAVQAAGKLYRRERNGNQFSTVAGADKEYAGFLFRFWRLYQEAQKAGATVTVKLLDQYLLFLAKEGAKK